MDLSTIIKIFVGLVNFIIAAFLIKSDFNEIKIKGRIPSNKIYLYLLVIVMLFTTVYTILDGYDANKSSNLIGTLKNDLNAVNSELKTAKKDREVMLFNLVSSGVKLKDIQDKLAPFSSLALKKYPDLDSTSALKKLYEEINKIKEDLVEVSLQSEFKSVSQKMKNDISSELKKSALLKNIKFILADWSGRPVNQLVSKEMGDIIKSAGLSCEIQNGFGSQGGYIPPPIEINVEVGNTNVYNEFIKIFKPLFFDYQPKLREKGGMGNDLRIRFFGSPSFKMDGRIKYQ